MLKISIPVTTYEAMNFDLADFSRYVKDIRFFEAGRGHGDELTLYRSSGLHHICGFVDVPASILPGEPERSCDWDDYAREHIELIYDYLVEKRGDFMNIEDYYVNNVPGRLRDAFLRAANNAGYATFSVETLDPGLWLALKIYKGSVIGCGGAPSGLIEATLPDLVDWSDKAPAKMTLDEYLAFSEVVWGGSVELQYYSGEWRDIECSTYLDDEKVRVKPQLSARELKIKQLEDEVAKLTSTINELKEC